MKTLLTILFIGVCSYSIAQGSYRKMSYEGPVIKHSVTHDFDSKFMTYEENRTSGFFFLFLTGLAIYGEMVSVGPYKELAVLYGAAATYRLIQARKMKKRNNYLY